MKIVFNLVWAVSLISLFIFSCKKGATDLESGFMKVNFSLSDLKSVNATQSDTLTSSALKYVVVSIEDLTGKFIKNSEKIELYNLNGNYISKSLSLLRGNYKLTSFFVLDENNNVVYISPLQGSSKAYLVTNPLPLSFTVQTNVVTEVTPEVLNASGSKAEDFGYTPFAFNIAQTFDFLVGTFIYDDSIRNYKLTSSSIAIYTDTVTTYSGNLNVNPSSILLSKYDSLGITNRITLPERFDKYKIVISKPGYIAFIKTFSKEELKLCLRSTDKGPLVIKLEASSLTKGLVAYYQFNGNVLDYSVFNNNGTYNGREAFTLGYKTNANGALDLNGSTDYVSVKYSSSLSITKQISLCVWYYPVPFYGNGNNSLISKYPNGNNTNPDFLLSARGSEYGTPVSSFAINTLSTEASINTVGPAYSFNLKRIVTYQLYNWYFIVGTYDGTTQKLYVNGELLAWRSLSGDIKNSSEDINIGKTPSNRAEYDFLAGRVDGVRIYNRALNDEEIQSLYQQ